MSKPTPTQEELDRAALGEHVIVKEPDGSGLENPPESDPDRPQVDPLKRQKQMEAKPAPAGGGYQTRHVTPQQPQHPPPLQHPHTESTE